MKAKVSIKGMTCEHCVKTVTEALMGIEGVLEVDVKLEGGYAILDSTKEITDEVVELVIVKAGYELNGTEKLI